MEWVKPKALLEALARGNGSAAGVIDAVRKRAALGAIRAKAEHLVQDGVASTDAPVPQVLWSAISRGLDANWSVGDFSAMVQLERRPSARHIRIEALGVLFSREDAEKMGAIFDGMAAGGSEQPTINPETLQGWAARMVECGLAVKGFNGAILMASWRGPKDTVPLVKIAAAALHDAWKATGYNGRGRRPGHIKSESSA